MTDDRFYLIHISESIGRILEYVADGHETFMQSTLVQDAVLRNLQVLAESAKRISDTLRNAHPEINWRGIAAFRNVLVHDYLSIDLNTVWQVVERDLPDLKRSVDALLKELEDRADS